MNNSNPRYLNHLASSGAKVVGVILILVECWCNQCLHEPLILTMARPLPRLRKLVLAENSFATAAG